MGPEVWVGLIALAIALVKAVTAYLENKRAKKAAEDLEAAEKVLEDAAAEKAANAEQAEGAKHGSLMDRLDRYARDRDPGHGSGG